MNLDDAVAAVRERLERWEKSGDRNAVTEPGVLALAGRIWRAVRQGTTVEVGHTLARLHWAREKARGPGEDIDEIREALTLFTAVADVDPGLLPDEVRQLVPRSYHPSFVGPEHWGRRAIQMLKEVQVDEDLDKLDQVIELFGGTVEAYEPEHRLWPGDMSNLSLALHMRYFRRGDPTDLERAERAARAAVHATPSWASDLSTHLDNLRATMYYRAERTHDPSAWAEAVRLAARAVRATPADSELRLLFTTNLANTRVGRFRLTGDREELEEAVRELEWVVERTPEVHPDFAERQGFLGDAYHSLYLLTRDPRLLHQAVDLLLKALKRTPVVSPNGAAFAGHLSRALLSRFRETGDGRDLDGSLQMAETAVDESPAGEGGEPGAARRAARLLTLGNVLFAASEYAQDRPFLDRAVEAFREAVRTHPAPDTGVWNDPSSAACHAALGDALMTRHFGALGRVAPFGLSDLVSEAARLSWEAQKRSAALTDPALLEDVMEAHEARLRAVERTGPHSPDLGGHLCGLSSSSYHLYRLHGRRSDADRALELAERAVRVTPPEDPDRPDAVKLLAELLTELGGEAGADRALSLWRDLATDPSARPATRAAAAATAARALCRRGDWATAVDLYAQALDILPSLVTPAQESEAQEKLLARWSGLAAEAASCAIAAGNADRAVELLEQGRGILWSQLLDSRTELGALEAVDAELAERLTAVERELNAPPKARSEPWWVRVADRRLALTAERDDLVECIRALPGFGDFRRPPGIEELRRAAAGGPVVLIVSSQWRTDALIVTTTATRPVPLGVDYGELLDRTMRYVSGLHQYETGPRDALARVRLNLLVTSTLAWLWRDVAQPPLSALGMTGPSPADGTRPRLWWCPTGLLTLLPLHAAALPDSGTRSAESAGDSVQDQVTPSYTPTLRALLNGRAAVRAPQGTDRMLVVGMPSTPGHRPLPQVEEELAVLRAALPRATVLKGEQATHRAVRDALRTHCWAHLSCHGGQDLTRPSQGGVVLHDAVLTVADLRSDRYTQGEFVFLSACQTALGGVDLPDESIAVTSALQYTGWRQVIGTLWSVGATTAAEVTTDFYDALVTDEVLRPEGAAEALYRAVRKLRAAGHPPLVWAPFMHTGI
ncbi:CHAT domain-containing protein [Streptomyces sp. URMC 128]|uniref:CHAT domain-containing protein n=1 Tax=Streptomyces sp. URMC 128 TaxID=3423404 RepID=UPI003F1AB7C1